MLPLLIGSGIGGGAVTSSIAKNYLPKESYGSAAITALHVVGFAVIPFGVTATATFLAPVVLGSALYFAADYYFTPCVKSYLPEWYQDNLLVNEAISVSTAVGVPYVITSPVGMFFISNIPSKKELLIYSGIQSFIEMIADMSSENPTILSGIRDFAKSVGEFFISIGTPFGSTRYVHDTYARSSVVAKPLIKAGTIVHGMYASDNFTIVNVTSILESLNSTYSFNEYLTAMVGGYIGKDGFERSARFANFVGEPVSRTLDALSKHYQDRVTPFQNPGLCHVLRDFVRNGPRTAPEIISNTVGKFTLIDSLGQFYKKMGIANYIRESRINIDFSYLPDGVNAKSPFMKRIEQIGGTDSYFISKVAYGAATFTAELTERTMNNVVAMTYFSTPNKFMGNVFHAAYAVSPIGFGLASTAVGGYHIYNNVMTGNSVTVEDFVKYVNDSLDKKSIVRTPEDNCKIKFVGELIVGSNVKAEEDLIKCLDGLNVDQDDDSTLEGHHQIGSDFEDSQQAIGDQHHHDDL